jgi:serine/threonine protein kinase
MDSGSKDDASELAEVFADYVADLLNSTTDGIGPLCEQHPERADELKRLYEDWVAGARAAGTLANRLQRSYGRVDPGVALEDAAGTSADSSEVLSRLAEHAPRSPRYQLVGEVGRGGMGAILKVWDKDLRRSLAMKVTLGKSGASEGDTPPVDPKVLSRFLEEAQITGQLDHPGIVPVHELGLDAGGRVFFTMKLVKGEDLETIFGKVARGEDGWTPPRALGVLTKVCEAMAYAHSKGVLHRDLKPANIMVGRFGEVLVMDWGLARVMGEDDRKDIRIDAEVLSSELRTDRRDQAAESPDSPLITMDGDVVGTPTYMSPEQAMGRVTEMGPPSDVYALGAMLYRLISGQTPYAPPGAKLNAYAVWQRVQEGPPRPLHELAPKANAELVAICEKAMAREPGERYGDMNELWADIESMREGGTVRAFRPGIGRRLVRYWKHNTRATQVGVGILAALSVLLLADTAGLVSVQDMLDTHRVFILVLLAGPVLAFVLCAGSIFVRGRPKALAIVGSIPGLLTIVSPFLGVGGNETNPREAASELITAGAHEEALALLRGVEDHPAYRARTAVLRAEALRSLDRPEQALQALDSRDPKTLSQMGFYERWELEGATLGLTARIQLDLGRPDEALETLRKIDLFGE